MGSLGGLGPSDFFFKYGPSKSIFSRVCQGGGRQTILGCQGAERGFAVSQPPSHAGGGKGVTMTAHAQERGFPVSQPSYGGGGKGRDYDSLFLPLLRQSG